MPTQKEIKTLIKRRHPDYNEMVSQWVFFQETYEGGRDWFKNNIHRYFKEGDEYNSRVKRAYRFNHTREVVDLVNKYIFRAKINRIADDAPDSVKTFWKNTDGKGTNIDEFMKVVSKKGSISGCPWIVVDNKQTDISPDMPKSEESEYGIYAYIVAPEMILDMSWDEDGELSWILIQEAYRDDSDPFTSTGEVYARYRLWTRNQWHLFQSSNPKSKSAAYSHTFGDHNLGVVPVFRADNIISDERYVSPSMINDIAYLDRAVANYLSNLDEIIQDQTFSQLAIPAQGLLPGEDGDKQLRAVGTKRLFTYDGEHGSEPKYLSPDPRQAQLIISAIQQIINEIYHSVGLAGERTKQDNSSGIDNSSGVAKAKDFERVNALLISKSNSLERIENKLVELVALWAGEQASIDTNEELVSYPATFDVRGLFDEFDVAMQLDLIGLPVEIRGKQLEKVVEKLFPEASKNERQGLLDDLGSWVEESKNLKKALTSNTSDGEAARNRIISGGRQSDTKQRKANRVSESDQETGQ